MYSTKSVTPTNPARFSESSAKLPKFLVPTIRENLEAGGDISLGTFLLAAWCFYSDKQKNEKGESLDIVDALKDQLHRAAAGTENDWTAFLRQSDVFGDLMENQRFVEEYTKAVKAIYQERNIRKLMEGLIKQ